MDTSSLLAKVHLSQIVAQQLSLGDDASASIPGVDEPVPGKVTLISPALDPGSTTVEVWLKVDNKAGKYKAGTPVRVSIVGRNHSQCSQDSAGGCAYDRGWQQVCDGRE
jgi:hypothetical protein